VTSHRSQRKESSHRARTTAGWIVRFHASGDRRVPCMSAGLRGMAVTDISGSLRTSCPVTSRSRSVYGFSRPSGDWIPNARVFVEQSRSSLTRAPEWESSECAVISDRSSADLRQLCHPNVTCGSAEGEYAFVARHGRTQFSGWGVLEESVAPVHGHHLEGPPSRRRPVAGSSRCAKRQRNP
jgi:hypothetical protein